MAKKQIKAKQTLATTSEGYADLWRSRTAVSAFTIAALIALDLVKVSEKGAVSKGKGRYNARLLRALVKPTMVSHWTKAERLSDEGVTVKGLNEITERLSNPRYSYRTNQAAVSAMLAGLRSGNDVEIDGQKFQLGKVVTISEGLF